MIPGFFLVYAVHVQVVQLMMLDCKHAVALFIQNRDFISSPEVVKQLLNADNNRDSRYFVHLYLHSLFEVNPHAGKDFHDMQVAFAFFFWTFQPLIWILKCVVECNIFIDYR